MHLKRLGLILLCCVMAIFLSYQSIVSTVFAQNSAKVTIGGVHITNQKESEIIALLAEEVQKWKERPLIIEGKTAAIEIPTNYIHFDIPATIENYYEESKKPWYEFWSKQPAVQIPLEVRVAEDVGFLLKDAPLFYIEDTLEEIKIHASFLRESEVKAAEIPLSKDLMTRISFELQAIDGTRTNLSALAHGLNDYQLMPGEDFSFIETYGELMTGQDAETINFFASVLYSVVLQADVSIKERHSQQRLPGYLKPGIEAEVNLALAKDFVFRNNDKTPLIFTAEIENNHLQIELYGLQNNLNVSYSTLEEKVQPRTIYRLSPTVKEGEQKVLTEGSSGLRVTVLRKIYDEQNHVEEEQQISRDFYPPKHKVILVSSMQKTESPDESEPAGEAKTYNDQRNGTQNNDQAAEEEKTADEKEPSEEVQYDKGGNVITEQAE